PTEASDGLQTLLKDERFASRYCIQEIIGKGAHAAVYRAVDRQMEECVALKVMVLSNPDEDEKRFLAQAKLSKMIQHQQILTIKDHGKIGNVAYLAMPWVNAKSLRQILIEQKKLDVCRALQIGLQIVDILKTVHEAGWVHCDLKPENILIDGEDKAYLIDFEIAAHIQNEAWVKESFAGTIAYMAPEQKAGAPVHFSTDIYAWAMMVTEILTGFSSLALGAALEKEGTSCVRRFLKPFLNSPLIKVIEKGLDPDPLKRPLVFSVYQSLQQYISQHQKQSIRRRRMILAAAVLIVLVIRIGYGLFQYFSEPKASSSIELTETNSPMLSLDQNEFSLWKCDFRTANAPCLSIDYKHAKSLVGLRILWGKSHASMLTVAVSETGRDWKRLTETYIGRGGMHWVYFPQTKSRYWRLYFKDPADGHIIEIKEITPLYEMNTQSSSIEDPEFESYNAFDANPRTRWSSQFKDDVSLTADFQTPIEFSVVSIDWERAFSKSYMFEVSLDGQDWKRIISTVHGDGGTDLIWVGETRARYCRLLCIERGTPHGNSLWELSVWDRPCVRASSTESIDYRAQYATDGNYETRWGSDFADDQWIEFDYQKEIQFNRLTLSWEKAYAVSYVVLISSDRVRWKSIYETEQSSGAVEELSFETRTARYIKIVLKKRATEYGYSLYEVSPSLK
ncbi:MAG: discoidin domain-containing protein, partial [Chlamydiota bacterium]|nr:discoidin domain-containing protein [Chlamydiota bacterium]